ncbi:TolB family protein [Hymenobacter negativus]|uniref:Biopolymer transporter Tol n=1 Tax=Hymenobacter negativus TaxID=2795026 RepID=A0ABS3QIU9_9BACT|nr:hypothetical protein [Hymenobacter negativus]MBO2010645.1 hypothetical protein [Hymenobacter negativus]
MRRLLLPGLLSLFCTVPVRAQSLPVLPQNPPALRWHEVRTPHFRVLYAGGIDSAAQRTASRLETVHGPAAASLGVSPRPIAVVLQNQTTVSNGFVTFLPRHAEFFTTPEQGQGLGTVDWLDGLVVHEYRHVVQFEKARQGVGRVLGPLLGDGALGVAAVGVPQWFFEGDAVGNETAFTSSGRGRIPNFNIGLRANLRAGRHYSYQKAVNGSLRDQVPDWYVLGYFLTSYAKVHYGQDVWDRVLDRYYRFPFYPFSFSNALRRTTGLRVEDLYALTMHELDSAWRKQPRLAGQPPVRELSGQPEAKIFTEYQYPQYLTDSTILALKTGLDDIPQLVQLGHQGQQKKVFTLGQQNIPEMLSVGGGRAVWPEFRQHPRWGQQVYSELKVLDLSTGKLRRIGKGGRYAAAALSSDGRRLVAVRTDESYHHALVVLDVDNDQVISVLPNPYNHLYQQPRWLPDGRIVTVALKKNTGKTLQILDPATGAAQNLLPWANVNLTNPQPWGEYVLYNSPQMLTGPPHVGAQPESVGMEEGEVRSEKVEVFESESLPGVDNIYAVSVKTGSTYQVTSQRLGAYHAAPSPDGRTLAFHDYRATGARIVEMPLNPTDWKLVHDRWPQDTPDLYATRLAAAEPEGRRVANLLDMPYLADLPNGPQLAQLLKLPEAAALRYEVRRYSPLKHAFNLFSYGVVQSPSGNAVSVGLRSQDFLNTTQAFAGVGYDQTERTFSATGAFSYQGRFPVLDADVTYGGRDAGIVYQGKTYRDQWQYARVTAGLRLPLNLTHSRFLQALSLGTYFLHEQVYDYNLPVRKATETGPNTPLNALQTTLSYVKQRKLPARGVAPTLGYTFLGTWRTTPFGTGLAARQWAAQGSIFLPGLASHHAIRVRAGYQWQDQAQYQFAPAVSFPRGEGYTNFDRLRVASLDYNLPLAYTHWALGRWLYVQRLRAAVFADFAQGNDFRGADYQYRYRNAGMDALVLFNVLRLRTPVEAGVRVVYRGAVGTWVVEPLAFSLRL